jgi:hypothetical protein
MLQHSKLVQLRNGQRAMVHFCNPSVPPFVLFGRIVQNPIWPDLWRQDGAWREDGTEHPLDIIGSLTATGALQSLEAAFNV